MKISNKKKNERQAFMASTMKKFAAICPNCGKREAHYAVPSMKEPGFYICKGKDNDND